jgi:hypothetical protein
MARSIALYQSADLRCRPAGIRDCEAVLAVSFLSLGLRPGLVAALAIPLVLATTFVALEYLGISLQRISIGPFIIALGLPVDDAMIAPEMMVSRLEQGDRRNPMTEEEIAVKFTALGGDVIGKDQCEKLQSFHHEHGNRQRLGGLFELTTAR